MNTVDFGLGSLEQDFWRVAFLMIRIGAAFLVAPFFGAASVPAMARTCLAGAVAIFVAAWFPAITPPASLFSAYGLLAVAGEVLVGLALGFALQLVFAAPVVAAEVISGSMGMSMAMAADPGTGGQTTAFGQYFTVVLTLIFLATGAHLQFIAVLVESYRTFPPGQTWLGADRIAMIGGFAGTMFQAALTIALPVALILLLVQIVTGVLSRSAPALNLFALGLPAGVMAGIAALIVAAPLLYDQMAGLAEEGVAQSAAVIAR